MTPPIRSTAFGSRGFTLLELLIAITIFSIIASFAYAGLNVVLDSKQQTDQHLARLAKLQLGLHLMQEDIEQAVDRPIRDEYGDIQPAFRSGGFSGLLLELTRSGYANPMQTTRSQLQRVAYQIEEKTLYRLTWPALDRSQGMEPRRQKLFDGIEEIAFSFIDQALERQTAWPPPVQPNTNAAPPALPKGVEVVIETEHMGTLRRVYLAPDSMPAPSKP